MSLIIISNKLGCDWDKLSPQVVNPNEESSVIVLEDDFSSLKYFEDNNIGILPNITFIMENTINYKEILGSIKFGNKNIYVAVHDRSIIDAKGNPTDGSFLAKIMGYFKDYIGTINNNENWGQIGDQFTFVPFNHTSDNKVWKEINTLIMCILEGDSDGASSAKSRVLNEFEIIKKERMLSEESLDINQLLLPLAAYDLLKQANIENQDLQNSIYEAATISIDTLRSTFPDVIKHHPLDLDNYTETFHSSLQKISTELFK